MGASSESTLQQRPVTLAQEVPILHALTAHASRSPLSFHVPGHHNGKLFPGVFRQWIDAALAIDLTELPGLDNLQAPAGCIADSQKMASKHYQSQATLYCVNGSSGGVIASILALAAGRKVLVAAPFHQSLWRAFVLADATPVFCPFVWDEATLEPLAASPATVAAALEADPEIACVFLTSPSYTGRVAPVSTLADVAHQAGVPLVVDEAHGAHFGLHPKLPQHSVAAGADVVIQSVHKMLPALTQTAWVHVQGAFIDVESVRNALNLVQTTSPSYLLLASLDAAQFWLRHEGFEVVDKSLETLAKWRPQAAVTRVGDPFRLWFPTGSAEHSRDIESELAARAIDVEYANPLGVLCMLSLRTEQNELERLNAGLAAVIGVGSSGRALGLNPQQEQTALWRLSVESRVELELPPRQTWRARSRSVPIAACAGELAGELVVPYPPGIPLLFPGERISGEKAALLQWLCTSRTPVIGLHDGQGLAVLY